MILRNLQELLLAIKNNNLKKIKQLIDSDVELVEGQTIQGERPLELAIESENITIIKELLQAGAHPDYGGWTTPLDTAARIGNTQIVKLLLEAGANPDLIIAGNLPLTTAAFYGYLDIVKMLVNEGANVNLFDNNTGTTLEVAVLNGYYEIFNYLAPLTSTHLKQWSETHSLFRSVCDGNTKTVNFLVESGVNINQFFEDNYTYLMHAVIENQLSSVRVLLEWKADVNIQNSKGQTALMLASQFKSPEESRITDTSKIIEIKMKIIKLLIKANANVNAQDNDRNTALSLVKETGNTKIIQLLIEAGAKD